MLESIRKRYDLYGVGMGLRDETQANLLVTLVFLVMLIVHGRNSFDKGRKRTINKFKKEVKKNHKKGFTTLIEFANGEQVEARMK